MKRIWILSVIILLGLILRLIFINSSPPSLYGDELTIALDSYSILSTGHDQLGNFLPLTFPMGAGRPAGYVYFSAPFMALFGMTALGVRALSILSGLGIIVLLYLISKRFFNQKIGLITAGIASVSPWDISLSRGGFEAHFALFLALLGTYLFIKAKEKPLMYVFSALSFGLTLHTYPTYKVVLPIFLLVLFWFQNTKSILGTGSRKYFWAGVSLLLILGAVALSQTFVGGSEKRFSSINVFSQEKLKSSIEQKVNYERSSSQLPEWVKRYFHNRVVEYGKIIGENYLQNFSADFLFIHGDRNPRHNMATIGELYFFEGVLILIGLISFWHVQKRIILFLIFWIFLSAIPTAIVDLPHALRSAFMLPPLIILSALGFSILINYKNKIPLYLIGILFVIQFSFFIQKLYFLSPVEYNSFWSYSAKLASQKVIENKANYDYIFLSDKIDALEFAYPVYAKVAANQIIDQHKTHLQKYSFKRYDNVYFGSIPESDIDNFLNKLPGKILYIGNLSDMKSLKDYETVNGLGSIQMLSITRRRN